MAEIKGGTKLQAALDQLAKGLDKGASVQVGFFAGTTYPDGTPVATVAAIQNFGAPSQGIPPRPFFSNMIAEKSPEWPAALAANLKATNYDAAKAMDRMGQGIQGQLQKSILDTNSPPLAQSTIDRKGSSKPLIDTGLMARSVGYEVKS